MKTLSTIAAIIALLATAGPPAMGAGKDAAWTDPEAARKEDPDFAVQGEYGSAEAGAKIGVQVVALGEGIVIDSNPPQADDLAEEVFNAYFDAIDGRKNTKGGRYREIPLTHPRQRVKRINRLSG